MVRALTVVCLVLSVISVGRGVAFAGKPTVGILGVEVSDPSNQGIDQASTETAKGLTDGLRLRAKTGAGPLVLAPGSEKELIDEKMLNSCDNEQNGCMAKIGSDLGAEQLMFGNIQKKSNGYLVSLKLLSVTGKTIIRSANETIPYADAQGPALQSWAKKIYARLTGDNTGGMLVIKANVERGTVLIEGEPKGNLVGSRATISGLTEGRYRLAIDAEGYRRYETNVTINAGETTNANATLEAGPPSVGIAPPLKPTDKPADGNRLTTEGTVSQSHTNIWKPIAITSLIVAAGGATFWIVGDVQEKNAAKLVTTRSASGQALTDSDCGNSAYTNADANFSKACSRKTWTQVGAGITIGAGVIAAVSVILALHHHDGSETQNAVAGRKHRDRFAVTPVILPNGGGATLQLDW